MRKVTSVLLLSLVCVAAQALPNSTQAQTPPATAAAASSANPLLAILAFVPDTPDTRAPKGQGVSYVDFRAVGATRGVAQTPGKTFADMDKNAQGLYINALMRVNSGPEFLNYFQQLLTGNVVGFDWFAMDRALAFGVPPRNGVVLAGNFDANRIGKALSARDFQQTDVDGITVWNRFDDAYMNMNAVEPRDPFGGNLGMAARIALFPGYVANSRYWEIARQIVGAYKRPETSLASNADYKALAEAITDPQTYKGSLLQAQFVSVEAFASTKLADASKAPGKPDLSGYGTLAPYTLGVIADRQEGDQQVALAALLYPDADTAQKSAVELHTRLKVLNIQQVYDRAGATFDDPRVYKTASGSAVAIVSVRYALPPMPDSQKLTDGIPQGLVYRSWIRSMMQRWFFALVVGAPTKS